MTVTPFNSIEDLCNHTSFREGAGGAASLDSELRDSVKDGTFSRAQMQNALVEAREEIYSRCGQKSNDYYDVDDEDRIYRYYQLKHAEMWLAMGNLCILYGERCGSKITDSNMQSVAEVSQGADTPSPPERADFWFRYSEKYRALAEKLLQGNGSAWTIQVGHDRHGHRSHCSGSCTGHCTGQNRHWGDYYYDG